VTTSRRATILYRGRKRRINSLCLCTTSSYLLCSQSVVQKDEGYPHLRPPPPPQARKRRKHTACLADTGTRPCWFFKSPGRERAGPSVPKWRPELNLAAVSSASVVQLRCELTLYTLWPHLNMRALRLIKENIKAQGRSTAFELTDPKAWPA